MRALLAVLLVAACQSAPAAVQRDAHDVLYGETSWNCDNASPTSWVTVWLWRTPHGDAVAAHEATHVLGALKVGCREANRIWRTPALAVHDEAAAFCVGARAGQRSGYYPTVEAGVGDAAGDLAGAQVYARFGLDSIAAYNLIAAHCRVDLRRERNLRRLTQPAPWPTTP